MDPATMTVLMGTANGISQNTLGLGGTIYGIFDNERRYSDARDDIKWQQNMADAQFTYAKERDALLMEREDNAMQRKLADVQAAGFSPLAALGQQSATSVVGGSMPGIPGAVSPQGSSASASDAMSTWMHEMNTLFNAKAERSNKKEIQEMINKKDMDLAVKNGELALHRLIEQGFIDKEIADKHLQGVLANVQASLDINNKTLSFQGAVKTLENIPADANGHRNVVVVKDDEISDVRAFWYNEYATHLGVLSEKSFKGATSSAQAVAAGGGFKVLDADASISTSDSAMSDNSGKISKELDEWFAMNAYPISQSEYENMKDSNLNLKAHDAMEVGYGKWRGANNFPAYNIYEDYKRQRDYRKSSW